MELDAHEFAVIKPVLEEGWDAMPESRQEAYAKDLFVRIAEQQGAPLMETFRYEAVRQQVIDGVRMPLVIGDITITEPMVLIRAHGYVIPNEEAQKLLEEL